MHGKGDIHGRGDVWQGWGVCGRGGVCVAGGHAWRGVCVAGGMHGKGVAWHARPPPIPILRDVVNERAVRILLECILVRTGFPIAHLFVTFYPGLIIQFKILSTRSCRK